MKKTKIALTLASLISTGAYAGSIDISYTDNNGVSTTQKIEVVDKGDAGADEKIPNGLNGSTKTIKTVGAIDPTTDAWANFKLNVGVTGAQDASSVSNSNKITNEVQLTEEVLFAGGDYLETKVDSTTSSSDANNGGDRNTISYIKYSLTDTAVNSIKAVDTAKIENGLDEQKNTTGNIADRSKNTTLTLGGTTDMKVTTDGEGTVVYGLSDANKNKLNTESNFTINGSTTPSKTWKLNEDGSANTLDFSTGSNLDVSYDTTTGSIKYGLKDQVTLTDAGSITLGTTDANKITLDNTGIDVNGTKINNNGIISGVAEGIEDTDAVNVAQLKKIKPYTSVSKDDNIVIEEGTDADGTKQYGFSLNKVVNVGDGTSPLGTPIKIDGTTGVISGVADGKDDNDVVNVSQLKRSINTSTTEDKNIKINETTNANGGVNYGFSLNDVLNVGTTSPIVIDGNKGTIKAGDITINDGGKITGVRDGEISATSRDVVNGSQLYQVQNNIINKVNKNVQNRIDAGVAQANAMAGLIQTTEKGKKLISASVGGYGNRAALAVGLSGMTDNGKIIYKLGVGVGHNSTSDHSKVRVGGNASIGYQW